MLDYKSKINYANPHTNSLKVGLPKEIVKLLKVKPGDSIKWEVDIEDGKYTVIASKLE